ncbi:MAG: 50S ribosomal protein L6 [Thermotoga sp.]|nr:50S ribosomal protein L6 [Thermotogota bacterium]RKX54895.1 MAG: 50S ribosomal protein L6 [Thermotoga sp.]
MRLSRLAKQPIKIPDGVDVNCEDKIVRVKGPKGELSMEYKPYVEFEIADSEVKLKPQKYKVIRKSDLKKANAYYGLYWSLMRNMIVGVSQGYQERLKIEGTGYRVQLSGKKLILNLGFAHPVEVTAPEGIEFEVPDQKTIVVKGIDKELVGQIAANIRSHRKPEPYKGKGVRYEGEYVRRKEGKKV